MYKNTKRGRYGCGMKPGSTGKKKKKKKKDATLEN
jgi:hypothetical protein